MTVERYRNVIEDWDRFLDSMNSPEPICFRVPFRAMDEPAVLELLRDRGFVLEPHDAVYGIHRVVREPFAISKTLEHWLGDFYIQQASTGLAAPALDPGPGDRVLDLCAAPGGKTTHLADLYEGGVVVASDVDGKRIRALLANVYRMALPNVLVMEADGCGFPAGATFDRVLVDAPCSAEGNLRRSSGSARSARIRPSDFVRRITSIQESLLERALKLVRPGGVVLYVTCTFAPEENEAVVDRVLERTGGRLEPITLDVPHDAGLTGFEGARFRPDMDLAWRVYPHHLDSGGLFMARIRREGGMGAGALSGWTPLPPAVPSEFPPSDPPAVDSRSRRHEAWEKARERTERLRDGLIDRFGLADALAGYAWTERGESTWLAEHPEWPGDAWSGVGGWKLHSVGLRASKADPRTAMGERPTNQILRFLDGRIRRSLVDIPSDRILQFLEDRRIDMDDGEKGMVGVRHRGRVLGRGWRTDDVLVNEISKARSRRLAGFLRAGRGT